MPAARPLVVAFGGGGAIGNGSAMRCSSTAGTEDSMVLDVGRHGEAVDMELVGAGKAADLLMTDAGRLSGVCSAVWNIKSRPWGAYSTPSGVVLVSTMARCV